MNDEIKIEDLPGYREAIEREGELRSEAFIPDLPEFICGVEVLPLTLNLVSTLRGIQSPFICGSDTLPMPSAVALFLWCVSPTYACAKRFRDASGLLSMAVGRLVFNRARRKFLSRIARLDYAKAVAGIDRYISDAYRDEPGREDSVFCAPAFASQTSAVWIIASNFGWSEESILSMPLKRLFQYVRRLRTAADPKAITFNPSDKARRIALETFLNERRG